MAFPNVIPTEQMFLQGLQQGQRGYDTMLQRMMQKRQLEQQQKQFDANLAMQKQRLSSSMALNPLRQALLQQQIVAAKNANDPMFKFNQAMQIRDRLAAIQQPGQQEPEQMYGQGQGMMMPQDNMGAPQPQKGAYDPNLIQAMTIAGIDPGAVIPGFKQQQQLDLFGQKEALKQKFKQGQMTNKEKTTLEQMMTGSEQILPIIDEIQNMDLSNSLRMMIPGNKKASYDAKMKRLADTYQTAKGWGKTDFYGKTAQDIVGRHFNESEEAYKERLNSIRQEIIQDAKQAAELHPDSPVSKRIMQFIAKEEGKKSSGALVWDPQKGSFVNE